VGAAPARTAPDDSDIRKNMHQLIQLRWIAVVGQITTVLMVEYWLGVALPLVAMAMVAAALVALNLISLARLQSRMTVTNAELFVALAFDAAALTAQLYLSGGATNPFAFLFLLHVMLSALLLEAWSTWAIVAITVACFAFLTANYQPLALPQGHDGDLFRLHIEGMLVCFMLNAMLLVVFVARINRNLKERDGRLATLRQHAAEEDHIVRMGLLASGAAHELGTPLATIDVILSDWRREEAMASEPERAAEIDDMLIEIRRCKAIVGGILMSAGEARGEELQVTTVRAFLNDIVEDRRAARPAGRIDFDDSFGEDVSIVSDSALKQVIGNVIDNAVDASPRWVGVSAERGGSTLRLAVRDSGPGFSPEMLAGFGRPYSSTKGRPGGGLGLFLVVNVLRKLGGAVTAANRPEGGAIVTLSLPLAALSIDVAAADAV
jgi:two-component system sensor histidine kinase RegB